MNAFTEEELSVLTMALHTVDRYVLLTERETRIVNDLYGQMINKLADIENSEYGV